MSPNQKKTAKPAQGGFTIRLLDTQTEEVLATGPKAHRTRDGAFRGIKAARGWKRGGLGSNKPHIQAQILDSTGAVVNRYTFGEVVTVEAVALCGRLLDHFVTQRRMMWISLADEFAVEVQGWKNHDTNWRLIDDGEPESAEAVAS